MASTSNFGAQQLGKRAGVVLGIVFSCEQGIFERYTSPGRLLYILTSSAAVERECLSGGASPLLAPGRGVQRNREGGMQSVCASLDNALGTPTVDIVKYRPMRERVS